MLYKNLTLSRQAFKVRYEAHVVWGVVTHPWRMAHNLSVASIKNAHISCHETKPIMPKFKVLTQHWPLGSACVKNESEIRKQRMKTPKREPKLGKGLYDVNRGLGLRWPYEISRYQCKHRTLHITIQHLSIYNKYITDKYVSLPELASYMPVSSYRRWNVIQRSFRFSGHKALRESVDSHGS